MSEFNYDQTTALERIKELANQKAGWLSPDGDGYSTKYQSVKIAYQVVEELFKEDRRFGYNFSITATEMGYIYLEWIGDPTLDEQWSISVEFRLDTQDYEIVFIDSIKHIYFNAYINRNNSISSIVNTIKYLHLIK